ncbi:DeoR/GlpR family DNA-binding transcription regulator [Mycolicibacterium tokaiense]|jgi:DeoR/GlpR family transcriptional regulator of sugar metabolism|uniref:DeoR family transcriptional regulator n=1 Tax=Mycolicibacterium tokaiense TaxID=39695 RepID=A0A378T7Y2_9MYCO|nr:DeoR/GlpR family DNA-binding transcription regulator [Mycolicibacterium tokaiense]BBY88555.1 DeoR family transcriptional regulator [Mycolicibacterium tokaiense]STZ56922.1 DeoR family transcriptional regulator [Mycolicibacterium tokaiense]
MTIDAKTRRDLILQRARADREVSYAALAAQFDVSEMTIRRDIEALEARGAVRRVVGGAVAVLGKDIEPAFSTRVADAASEKHHIADAVAELIGPKETLILDAGSTSLAVARSLRGRALGLTVVTPSVPIAVALVDEPDTNVVMTGGELRTGELSLVGSGAEEMLTRYNCDTYVMGVAGIDAERGFSDYLLAEARMKRVALSRADRVIVAADRSKLGRVNFVGIAALAQVDTIVTDGAVDHPALVCARSEGVDVICLDEPKGASPNRFPRRNGQVTQGQ